MHSLTPDRLTAAKELIHDLLEPNGCLRIVLDSRLAAHGFSPQDVNAALDAISKEREVRVTRMSHPKLQGRLFLSLHSGGT